MEQIPIQSYQPIQPSFQQPRELENKSFSKKWIFVMVGLMIFVLGIFIWQQRTGTNNRKTAAVGDAVTFSLTPNSLPNNATGNFTTELHLNSNGNDVSGVDIAIESSDPNILEITSFTPSTTTPGYATLIDPATSISSSQGRRVRYSAANPSQTPITGNASNDILLGTIALTMRNQGSATLSFAKQEVTGGRVSTLLTVTNGTTPLGTFNGSSTPAPLACNVSFTFPTTIPANQDVSIPLTQISPAGSDTLWQYSAMYEVAANGTTIVNNFGGCPNNTCVFEGPQNTPGTHRIRFAVRDTATYGPTPGIQMPGQTGDKIWCTTQGTDTFTATAANTPTPTLPASSGTPPATPPPSSTPTSSPTPGPNDVVLNTRLTLPNQQIAQLPVTAEVFNAGATTTPTANATASFTRQSNGNYTGSINLGAIAPGEYRIKIKAPRYLRALIGKATNTELQALTAGTNNIGVVPLDIGDINGDNIIDLSDYNALRDCGVYDTTWLRITDVNNRHFNNPTDACNAHARYRVNADLNGDGFINFTDFNIFQDSILLQKGD